MAVIAFVGNKGGVGKTTLSLNFAAGISHQATVVLLDADLQGSALQWSRMSDDAQGLSVRRAGDDLQQQILELSDQYDHLIIDCPPYLQSTQTSTVLQLADVALIPVLPSPMDLWATVHVENAVREARKTNPGLTALLVINQLEIRTTFSRVMRDALSEIEFPVAENEIRRRAIYRNSVLDGKSVFDMGSTGRDAVEELAKLIREVLSL